MVTRRDGIKGRLKDWRTAPKKQLGLVNRLDKLAKKKKNNLLHPCPFCGQRKKQDAKILVCKPCEKILMQMWHSVLFDLANRAKQYGQKEMNNYLFMLAVRKKREKK